MNELMIFSNPEFGRVRTLEENGTVLFCASDVARALGYAKARNAIAAHCKCALKRGGVSITTNQYGVTTEQETEMVFIPESDLYRLVFSSKLPAAERFTDWVTGEVLPSIRRNGMYLLPKDYPSALRALADAEEKRLALAAENERQAQVIAEFEPIRQYVDTILESQDALATSQIAADYGMSAQQLNKILREEGVQHKVNGQCLLYKKHMNMGYTKSKTIQFTHSDGRTDTKLHTQWTQKGRLMIHNILEKRGIVAVMDRTCAS